MREYYYVEPSDVLEWFSDGKYKVVKRSNGSISGYIATPIKHEGPRIHKDRRPMVRWDLATKFESMREADEWYRSWAETNSCSRRAASD